MLIAFTRGRLIEGIDYTNELARAVFMIGVPYPDPDAEDIKMKKEYLDSVKYVNERKLRSNGGEVNNA